MGSMPLPNSLFASTLTARCLLICGLGVATLGCKGKTKHRELKGKEIKALFANRSVSGHHEIHGYDFRSYYDPGGTLRSYQGDNKRPRHARWWIKRNDICIRWQDQRRDLCRRMVHDGKSYFKVRAGSHKLVVSFKSFTPGNPWSL